MGVEYKLQMEVTCDTCSLKHFFTLHAGSGSFLDQDIDAAQELLDLQTERGWKLTHTAYERWEATCPHCQKGQKVNTEIRGTIGKL